MNQWTERYKENSKNAAQNKKTMKIKTIAESWEESVSKDSESEKENRENGQEKLFEEIYGSK